MVRKTFDTYVQIWMQSRFLILLVLIMLLILLTPFLDDFIQTRILMDVFLTAIFIGIIYTIRLNKTQTIIAVILVLPLIISTWAS